MFLSLTLLKAFFSNSVDKLSTNNVFVKETYNNALHLAKLSCSSIGTMLLSLKTNLEKKY